MLRQIYQVGRKSHSCFKSSIHAYEHIPVLKAVEATVMKVPSVGLSTTPCLLYREKGVEEDDLDMGMGKNMDDSLYSDNEPLIASGFSWGSKIRPDLLTEKTMVNGVPYNELPIIHVTASHNNTIITISDAKGNQKLTWSAGLEGYRNKNKGSTVASQATGIAVAKKATEKLAYKDVRVKMKGIGAGRLSVLRGLQVGGLSIVSITDATPVRHSFRKAKKPRVI